MGKDKRSLLKALMLFAIPLFVACDILKIKKSYLDTIVENYWNAWTANGDDSLDCYIDFAEVVDFDWDTMLYFSGQYYLYDYVKNDSVIEKYIDAFAKKCSDEQVFFLLGDSVVHKMTFIADFDFDMEVVPKGVCFCTKKLYFKLGRDNAKFHLVRNGLQYRLYHMDDIYEEENSVKKESLSPYVGAWEWVSDGALSRKINVIIGERNDSLYLAFSWNFMDKGECCFYTTDKRGLPLACVRMLRPQKNEVVTGKIFNTFFSVGSLYVKEFENMQLTLYGNDTLAWNVERKYLWPDSLILVRRDKFNYKFSDYVPYIHDDVSSLQRLLRGFESLDFTY